MFRMASLRRPRALALVVAVSAASVSGLMAGPAQAAAFDTTTGTVTVGTSLQMLALSPTFAIAGGPGATVASTAPVTFTVITNNVLGYHVTVAPVGTDMVGTGGNTAVIPFSLLQVEESVTGTFAFLSATRTVHNSATATDANGDDLSTDFQLTIPNVLPDAYSGDLTYTAVANLV
jgi:hypothetical protein